MIKLLSTILLCNLIPSAASAEKPLEKRILCATKKQMESRLDDLYDQYIGFETDISDQHTCQPGSSNYDLLENRGTVFYYFFKYDFTLCADELLLREKVTGDKGTWYVMRTCTVL